jgi:hypothetical protein
MQLRFVDRRDREQLRELVTEVFAPDVVMNYAQGVKLVQRERQLDVLRRVLSLVLTGGTEKTSDGTPFFRPT